MVANSLTFQEVALKALEHVDQPLDRVALWKSVVAQGLDAKLKSQGKTPWETMAARLYVEVRDNPKSEVVGIGRRPVRFWLRSRPLPPGWTQEGADKAADAAASKKPKFLEKHLHPLLAHFAYEQMGGVRVRTINHSSSKKTSYGEWVHPDVIGVLFPMTALGEQATVDFGFALQAPLVRIYSFELKRSVSFSNLRECFFQAVSNSSWAHEGYLVAAEWNSDPEFSDELRRLSQAFGIGAIALDVEDPSQAKVILPARPRDELDWSTLDKLVAMNPDVREFVDSVRIDLGARKAHASEYDEVLEDAQDYAAKISG